MKLSNQTHVRGRPTVQPAEMRDVLGHFASGLVVITTAGLDGPLGFTCQSFASLSLDPPLVSFCPARTSSTWPKIRDVGRFCVNVLAEHHEPISSAFARSGTDKFASVEWTGSPMGAPMLSGVCAWIDCVLVDEHEGGDHTIVVAQVVDLGANPSRQPLLYHRGGYGIASPAEEDAV
jgi:flavin reductase (DIM6/NTAB) family NADH-FMN oxidoreductase RutF